MFINFWNKNTEKDKLSIRKVTFEAEVLRIVKDYHTRYLEEKNLNWENGNDWHSEFDLNSLPDIEKAQIPEKPEIQLPKIEKFIDQQFGISEQSKENQLEILKIPEISEINGLSPSIAAKIMAKDRLLKQQKSRLLDNCVVVEHNKGERLIKLIEILKVLFSTHKTPSMFWDILVNKLGQMINCKNRRIVEEDLNEIIANWPEFVSLIQTNSGPVVRVNRGDDVKLIDLKQKLIKKYNLG